MGESLTPLRVGMVGVGAISGQYFDTVARIASEVQLIAVADRDDERATAVAAERGIVARTVDDLFAAPDIDLILNLTVPGAHAEVARRAIDHGKHSYGEKPLALTTAQARPLIAAAEAAGVWLGCAPDTVLGSGIQSARHAVDSGFIGTPVAATATFVSPGHEAWHPNPDFYYVDGGGPLLDMGPYCLHALVHLRGPVVSVFGASSRSRDSRTIASGPRAGETIPVSIDTHVTAVLEHASGALSTLITSFDATATHAAPIEVHGTAGTLAVPDPNMFDGTSSLRCPGDAAWQPLPIVAGFEAGGRGIGLLDFARTPAGAVPRADASLALHALEVMEATLESARTGRRLDISPGATRPRPVPLEQLSVALPAP